MRLTTIALILNAQKNAFLMGYHQRGEGKNKLNFVGGKVADKPEFAHETPEESIQREIREETKIVLETLIHQADIFYRYPPSLDQQSEIMKVYRVDKYSGHEQEDAEEFRLVWVKIDHLPLNKMWPSDSLWLPRLFSQQDNFYTIEFTYDKNKKLISKKYATSGISSQML